MFCKAGKGQSGLLSRSGALLLEKLTHSFQKRLRNTGQLSAPSCPKEACHGTWAQIWSSAGVEAHSVLPNTGLQAHACGLPLLPQGGWLPHLLGTALPGPGAKRFLDLFAQGLVPLRWGSAREPKHTGEGPKPHPYVSALEVNSKESTSGRHFLGVNGGKLAVQLPSQAKGTGSLILSVRESVL